jgi:hypothetical protein
MSMYLHDRMLELMEAEGIRTMISIPIFVTPVQLPKSQASPAA